jgi:dihydrofolate reductase
MSKLIHLIHISVDGYIEGPNGEFDWPTMGPELSAYSIGLNNQVGTLVYGRVVWELMASYWPNVESLSDDEHDLKFAPIWRRTPKVVFSRTLKEADHNTRVVGDNLVEEINALKKASDKDLLLTGGSSLAASLTEHRLIDEYHVAVHPVVLGGGRPQFPADARRVPLALIDAQTFDARVALLRYRPNADI